MKRPAAYAIFQPARPLRHIAIAIALCIALALPACSDDPGDASGASDDETSASESAAPAGGGATGVGEVDGAGLGPDELAAVQEAVDRQRERQDVEPAQIPDALIAARKANADVCAWLYVSGTNVSLAVAQHPSDDTFYIFHNAEGGRPGMGTAYMESMNSPSFDDPVTVLYGHSFSDADLVFTQLHNFENKRFFENNEYFYIYLPGKVLTYRIAAACLYTDVHILSESDFANADLVQGYLSFAVNPGPSIGFQRDVGAVDASEDRIVQLSTCTVPASTAARFVVTGILVDEQAAGEQ